MTSILQRRVLAGLVTALTLSTVVPASADVPFPLTPDGTDIYDYADYLRLGSGNCAQGNASTNDLPFANFCESAWKFSDWRPTPAAGPGVYDPATATNPQEFFGVRGTGLNRAWEVTTGRPDVVIAVTDSGIQWDDNRPNLVRKFFINSGELPLPDHLTNTTDARYGGYDVDGDPEGVGDTTGQPDGVFNVSDYRGDSRVIAARAEERNAEGAITREAGDLNNNSLLDPEDLILIFSDGIDDDGNGYVDDISGWDFFENDNDPQDDTDYGHGTGEAGDSAAETDRSSANNVGTCPNCMTIPLRVGDSFVADVNHFAEAVVYAVDNGVQIIQEALGTLNHTSFGQAAIDYAYNNGVLINASQADEAAGHHNWPAAYDHTMLFNSITPGPTPASPNSYLYLNGCTNFGGYSYVSIPSTSCSSEAVGRGAGYSALAYSAALNAMEQGDLTGYVEDDGTVRTFPLSAEELKQLTRLAADDIDFATPGAAHPFAPFAPADALGGITGPPDNSATNIPSTKRYQSAAGWDYFHGYGRMNVARLVRFLGAEFDDAPDREFVPTGPYGVGEDPNGLTAQDRIPPEADLPYPRFWHQYGYGPDGNLLLPDDPTDPDAVVVHGHAAANRVTAAGGTFGYVLEYAPQVQGQPSATSPLAPAAAGADERSGGPWTRISTSADNPACTGAAIGGLAQCSSAVTGEIGRVNVGDLADALAGTPNPFLPATDPTSTWQPEQNAIRLRLRVIANPVNPNDTVNNQAVHQKQIDVYPAEETVVRDDLGVRKAGDPGGIGQHDAINTDALGRYAGGAGSPSLHDLNGDGIDELLLPTSDGVVHAFTNVVTGAELPGWPVQTPAYQGIVDRLVGDGTNPVDNAFTRGDVTSRVNEAILAGTVAVVDLDNDGTLEVTIGDLGGNLSVWEHDGTQRAGFPVTSDPAFSKEQPCNEPGAIPFCDDYDDAPLKRDKDNARDGGFNSTPAVGDLDNDPTNGLEIVVGSNDTHVYAFHQDGSTVDGWPVVLRDPENVAFMDPDSHFYCYDTPSPRSRDCNGLIDGNGTVDAAIGSKILVSPSLGDLDGDGDLEVVIGVNEEYVEAPNASISDPVLGALNQSGVTSPGNTRIYALQHTGENTPGTAATDASPHTQDQAYLPGWPVKAALLVTDLLPYVGAGTNAQAVLFDADGDAGDVEIAIASAAGPAYLFDGDGTSLLPGGPDADGTFESSVYGPASAATDTPGFVGVGSMAAGSLDGGQTMSVVAPGAGLARLLDIILPAQQLGAQDTLQIWDAATGEFQPNAPFTVNDLQFFTPPIVADVSGDGMAEAIQATAVGDLVAASGPTGDFATDATALRHFTGGWTVSAATVGTAPGVGSGNADLVNVTREGYLRLYETPVTLGAATCTALSEWPEYGHDAANSGNYLRDAERPGPLLMFDAEVVGANGAVLTWTSSGDDRRCGIADHFELRQSSDRNASWLDATPVTTGLPNPGAAGATHNVPFTNLPDGSVTYLLRAFDEAGNGSAVARDTIRIGVEPTPTPTTTVTPTPTTSPTVTAQLVARAVSSRVRTVSGESVTFDGRTSTVESGPATFAWRFSDGSTASGAVVQQRFAAPGIVTATLTVDDGSRQSVATTQVQVVEVVRRAGATRVETAVEISASTFPRSSVALLATATNYADALTGAPLAARMGAPLLLTQPDNLPGTVLAELDRLGASKVIVLGGNAAVSSTVDDQLRASGRLVERIAGENRFATAASIAEQLGSGLPAYVVEGANASPNRGWPDALSVAPLAAHLGRPILLARADELPAETAAAIRDRSITAVTVIGGPVAVQEATLNAIRGQGIPVERVAGDDRFATSALVAERGLRAGLEEATVYLATGRAFPDALAGGPAAAAERSVLLLVEPTSLGAAPTSRAFLSERLDALRRVRILGGTVAIQTQVETDIRTLIIE